MDAQDAVQFRELLTMADGLPSGSPAVRRFVSQAFGHIERLSDQLRDLEQRDQFHDRPFFDGNHRDRLENLVHAQADEIAQIRAAIDRVRALAALAKWAAASTGGDSQTAAIGVGDLLRALDTA